MTAAFEARPAGGPRAAAVTLAVFGIWALALAASSQGFLEADEAAHYLYARHAPSRPMNLLHVWARPLYTTLLVPFAQGGLPTARIFSAASAIAAAGFAFLACRALGWRAAACAIPFTFAQPLFFQQTFGIWTEIAFAAGLGGWAAAVAGRRPMLAALAAAALPLVRPEGVIVCAATGIAAVAGGLRGRDGRPRRVAPILLLPAGVVLWAALAFLASGDPLWLARNWPPDWAPGAAYGRGSWEWLPGAFLAVVPGVLAPLVLAGCFAPAMRSAWPIPFAAALVLAVHAILWAVGAFGSAGYARYFVTLAPVFGMLAAGGVELLARRVRFPPAWAWTAAAAVLAGVLLVRHPSATSPPPRPPDARLLAALGRWIGAVDPAPVLHSAHPFSYLQLPSIPEERFADFGRVRSETLQAAPPGTWVVVEDRFWTAACGNEGGGWPGANPGEADLKAMGYAPVAVPDLGVDMTHGDPRHDAATSTMSWALYRKTR